MPFTAKLQCVYMRTNMKIYENYSMYCCSVILSRADSQRIFKIYQTAYHQIQMMFTVYSESAWVHFAVHTNQMLRHCEQLSSHARRNLVSIWRLSQPTAAEDCIIPVLYPNCTRPSLGNFVLFTVFLHIHILDVALPLAKKNTLQYM